MPKGKCHSAQFEFQGLLDLQVVRVVQEPNLHALSDQRGQFEVIFGHQVGEPVSEEVYRSAEGLSVQPDKDLDQKLGQFIRG